MLDDLLLVAEGSLQTLFNPPFRPIWAYEESSGHLAIVGSWILFVDVSMGTLEVSMVWAFEPEAMYFSYIASDSDDWICFDENLNCAFLLSDSFDFLGPCGMFSICGCPCHVFHAISLGYSTSLVMRCGLAECQLFLATKESTSHNNGHYRRRLAWDWQNMGMARMISHVEHGCIGFFV